MAKAGSFYVFFLNKETTHLRGIDRTKKFRFGCLISRELNKGWPWDIKKLTIFVIQASQPEIPYVWQGAGNIPFI